MNFQEKLELIQRIHKGDTLKDIALFHNINFSIKKIEIDYKNKKISLKNDKDNGKMFKTSPNLSKNLCNIFFNKTIKNIYNEVKENDEIELIMDEETELLLNLF